MSYRKTSVLLLCFALAACETVSPTQNTAGRATTYQDPGTRGIVSGVGIESQDVNSMTDRMVRDLISDPRFTNRNPPPRVIVDSRHFRNESTSRINVNAITDRLRVGLNRAARGRIVFLGREYIDVVERERELKRAGKVDVGTTGLTRAAYGADYRLVGRITSQDQRQIKTGLMTRTTRITFELLDLETDADVWGGEYEFTKTAADDILYR